MAEEVAVRDDPGCTVYEIMDAMPAEDRPPLKTMISRLSARVRRGVYIKGMARRFDRNGAARWCAVYRKPDKGDKEAKP